MTPTSRRGGKRAGAGRKPLAPERRRVHRTVMLAPETDAWLDAVTPPQSSIGVTIDHLVAGAMRRDDPAEYPAFVPEEEE